MSLLVLLISVNEEEVSWCIWWISLYICVYVFHKKRKRKRERTCDEEQQRQNENEKIQHTRRRRNEKIETNAVDFLSSNSMENRHLTATTTSTRSRIRTIRCCSWIDILRTYFYSINLRRNSLNILIKTNLHLLLH